MNAHLARMTGHRACVGSTHPERDGHRRRVIGQTVRVMPIFSRRSVLGAAIVVLAGGAGVAAEFLRHPHRSHTSTGTGSPSKTGPTTTPTAPTATVLQSGLARERALLDRLAQAATAAPDLAASIAILRADHRAHAEALAGLIRAVGVTPAPAGTSASAPSASASAPVRPPTAAELARWEKAAAASFAADFATATGTAAAVLASIYACEQTHVAWLT